jgi:hypothetical protein
MEVKRWKQGGFTVSVSQSDADMIRLDQGLDISFLISLT